MSCSIDICLICLEHSNNLILISSQNTNGTSIEDKLKYFVPELGLKLNIPKYICAKCERSLNRCHDFRQKCIQNITIYEKYAQQVTTYDGAYKNISVIIRPDFVCKEEISNENNFKSQNEIEFVNVDNCEELFIKKETNEELVLDDKLKSLLHEIKNEKPETNEDIAGENLEISFSTGNVNTNDQGEKEQYESSNNEDVEQDKLEYKCEICNKSLKCLQNLKRHQLSHTNKNPYICEICNKSCRHLQHLQNHRLIHTGEKPFTCKMCNKSFRQMPNLKKHQLLHTDEKPYTCEVCNKPFRHQKHLKEHHLIHTGEKPYACEICSKSFRHLQTLKKHNLLHTGEKPFTCEVCQKSFRILQTLKQHKLVHTGEKPYTCEVCNKLFNDSSNLKRHRSSQH